MHMLEALTAAHDGKQVQDVVGHPALVITRNVEWGTVIFGFEQANKYTIYDQQGNVIALMAEELGSFGKEVGRQLLRTRRPFTATVFSPDGQSFFGAVRSSACRHDDTTVCVGSHASPI